MATQPIKDEDPGIRSNIYIDDTRDNYLSGWKAFVTNVMPHKTLESGRWFGPSPVPRPFAMTAEMTPFSDEMRNRLRDNSTDGLIVVKDGTVVQQYFRYGFGIDDIHLIHSTGKVFTSFALQPLYDRIGPEGLAVPLEQHLPQLQGKFFGEATLGQTLDMKNGMEWSEDYEDPNSATMISGPVGGWDPLDPAKGPENWYERMFDFPKAGEHGETWVYSSASIIGVALAAEAIEGRHYGEIVQGSYDRLGFEDRSWYVSNAFNQLSAEGGQCLTIRDHAKLGRHMIETTGSAYVDDVWAEVGDPDDPADAIFLEKYGAAFDAVGYKNYWYNLGEGAIMGLGSSGQWLYVDRSKNLIISKFSSFVQGQGAEEFVESMAIIREIAAQY
jgi:CubicO group peptidase (beta-lactamase class C family)